ncbi:cytidine deaminase [Eurytemora carolleeae]|uniref:cytidine deaminase n=1 Tax=Eurytemora carolleeae TaxID=1294199 RepID=UPI000C77A5F6|nr:cytidine deaminase [Eurytemora carolleeae]|eukprot:XP_023344706.1 cytidine deaminase-like [Eurytemora affinis]
MAVLHISDMEDEIQKICEASLTARQMSYSPYSKFKVGAAILCSDGIVVTGCNIENASYGLSICAERTALVKAVSEGRKEFKGIAIAADIQNEFVGPCGACRQFMAEFNPTLPIFLVRVDRKVKVTDLGVLLPESFTPKNTKFDFYNGE